VELPPIFPLHPVPLLGEENSPKGDFANGPLNRNAAFNGASERRDLARSSCRPEAGSEAGFMGRERHLTSAFRKLSPRFSTTRREILSHQSEISFALNQSIGENEACKPLVARSRRGVGKRSAA